MNKYIVSAIIFVVGVAIAGAYFYPKFEATGSPAGTTFSSAKVASAQVTLGTTTAFSILNGDASARIISSAQVSLRGGISTSTNYIVACATSTTASSFQGNSNYIFDATISAADNSLFGTTTGAGLNIASTSPGLTGRQDAAGQIATSTLASAVRTWGSGVYLNCLVTTGDGYNAFNSGISGTISFPYFAQ